MAAVLAASPERRRHIASDEGACVELERFNAGVAHILRLPLFEAPLLTNWQELIHYLHADMAHRKTECFRVLHLNSRNMLIRDEVMSEGSIDQSSVYVREVVHRALDLGSASIILVHNHPSGDPSASRADVDITRAIADAARRLGVAVHDHLIIGAQGHRSLRAEGLF